MSDEPSKAEQESLHDFMPDPERNRYPIALPKGVDRVSDLGTLMTLKEAATRLGVSPKTVRRMIERGALVGSHQVPMPSGKGSQWVVPYSAVVEQETKTAKQATPDPVAGELAQLREENTKLKHDLELSRALADERRQSLEQLHTTMRVALAAGKSEQPRRWWQKKTAQD
jgi:excisionase family DNA binding protein